MIVVSMFLSNSTRKQKRIFPNYYVKKKNTYVSAVGVNGVGALCKRLRDLYIKDIE